MSAHILADRLSPGFMRCPLLPDLQARTDPDRRASLSPRWGSGSPNAHQRRDLAPLREALPVTQWGSSPPAHALGSLLRLSWASPFQGTFWGPGESRLITATF